MTVNNPHAEAAKNAMATLKELASSLDGWEFTQELDGVKLYSKTIEDNPFTIVRGDTLLEGHEFTPQQIATIATLPGARKIWDEKYDTSEIKEMYSQYESLFWSKVKAPWPVYPRDFCGTSLREISTDECFVVMTSVEDEKVPLDPSCVRGNLLLSGWKINKTMAGIEVIYITQVDLAGSIPVAFMKGIQQQVPLCAGKVVQYAKDYGFLPTIVESHVEVKAEEFDHEKTNFSVTLDGKGSFTLLLSKKMYPQPDAKLEGSQDATWRFDKEENDGIYAYFMNISGPTIITIFNQ